jgi:hypothetical protein
VGGVDQEPLGEQEQAGELADLDRVALAILAGLDVGDLESGPGAIGAFAEARPRG